MKKETWQKQEEVIKGLIAYLDKTLPRITEQGSAGNVFLSASALYRCNRYLRAVQNAVYEGTGDTAGGNLRTLYETWVLGHLLLLSTFDEARKIWGGTRHSEEKLLRAIGAEASYPEDSPEASKDVSVEERAKTLKKRLETNDPENAAMPTHCYDYIYRSESQLSSHANLTAITQYIKPLSENDSTIGLHERAKGCEWRVLLAANITIYFAKRLFIKAGISTSELDKIDKGLDYDGK